MSRRGVPWSRRFAVTGLVMTAAVACPKMLAAAELKAPTSTFGLSATSASDSKLTYMGKGIVGSAAVLVFTADRLTLSGATLGEPCFTDPQGSVSARVSTGAPGRLDASESVIIEATRLGFAGLPSPYTPANPPSRGTVLPAALSNLDLVAYLLVAGAFSEQSEQGATTVTTAHVQCQSG